jgi:hypothetical protein
MEFEQFHEVSDLLELLCSAGVELLFEGFAGDHEFNLTVLLL